MIDLTMLDYHAYVCCWQWLVSNLVNAVVLQSTACQLCWM